jgi:hypothetical protein
MNKLKAIFIPRKAEQKAIPKIENNQCNTESSELLVQAFKKISFS